MEIPYDLAHGKSSFRFYGVFALQLGEQQFFFRTELSDKLLFMVDYIVDGIRAPILFARYHGISVCSWIYWNSRLRTSETSYGWFNYFVIYICIEWYLLQMDENMAQASSALTFLYAALNVLHALCPSYGTVHDSTGAMNERREHLIKNFDKQHFV